MKKKTKGLFVLAIFVWAFTIALTLINIQASTFNYEGKIYSVTANSVIQSLKIYGHETAAKYKIFTCEEDHQLTWKTETTNRIVKNENTLFTYSSLFTFDVYKTYIFNENGFTLQLSKVYLQTGWSDNNQIVIDINNQGFNYTETSFTFYYNNVTPIKIDVTKSNTPITIQPPSQNYPSELQFNFNGYSDRDLSYHKAGDIETVLFNITIGEN